MDIVIVLLTVIAFFVLVITFFRILRCFNFKTTFSHKVKLFSFLSASILMLSLAEHYSTAQSQNMVRLMKSSLLLDSTKILVNNMEMKESRFLTDLANLHKNRVNFSFSKPSGYYFDVTVVNEIYSSDFVFNRDSSDPNLFWVSSVSNSRVGYSLGFVRSKSFEKLDALEE